MRGPSVQGARRSARGGVLEQYVEHGEQAQRSNGGLSARGKSRARAKNGDCHEFAPRHIPRNKVLSLKRIGWLYPIFRGLRFTTGCYGVLRPSGSEKSGLVGLAKHLDVPLSDRRSGLLSDEGKQAERSARDLAKRVGQGWAVVCPRPAAFSDPSPGRKGERRWHGGYSCSRPKAAVNRSSPNGKTETLDTPAILKGETTGLGMTLDEREKKNQTNPISNNSL